MSKGIKIIGLLAAAAALSACESSDINRAAIGGAGGYAIDRATGGDGTRGAAAGIIAGTVCDDVTPGICS